MGIAILYLSYLNINDEIPYMDVSGDEVKEISEMDDEQIIYFYSSDCVGCSKQKIVFKNHKKTKDIDIYGVNVNSDLTDSALLDKYNITVTPTIIVTRSDEIIKRNEGYIADEGFDEFLKK